MLIMAVFFRSTELSCVSVLNLLFQFWTQLRILVIKCSNWKHFVYSYQMKQNNIYIIFIIKLGITGKYAGIGHNIE